MERVRLAVKRVHREKFDSVSHRPNLANELRKALNLARQINDGHLGLKIKIAIELVNLPNDEVFQITASYGQYKGKWVVSLSEFESADFPILPMAVKGAARKLTDELHSARFMRPDDASLQAHRLTIPRISHNGAALP